MFYKLLFTVFFMLTNYAFANIFNDTKSFSAEFQQSITNASDTTIVYKGEVFIKNKNMLLWKYKTPIIKNVYVLDSEVIVDEPELEQAIYTKLDKEINLYNILNNAEKINETSYVAKLRDIKYTIAIKNDILSSISYVDEIGNKVVINFSNTKINKDIKDDVFYFFPPQEYDILRN